MKGRLHETILSRGLDRYAGEPPSGHRL